MRTRSWWTLGFILLLTALAALAAWPTDIWLIHGLRFKPGLDIQGGTQLVYELDTSGLESNQRQDAIDGVQAAMRSRIDAFGVSEPLIFLRQIGDRTAINIDLPGISDVNQAKTLIGQTAKLEFWEPAAEGDKEAVPTQVGFFKPTKLSGSQLRQAQTTFQGSGGTLTKGASEPVVQLQFDDEGKQLFGELTSQHLGQPIAIVLDGQIISAPTVQAAITDGTAIITGNFSVAEAKQLTIQLNAGALPIPVSLVEERTVGATLGSSSIQASLFAGVVGFGLVILFISFYYGLPGILASLALVIYAILTIALYKSIGVTFSLASIAGFLISIGMAVDANVLIFERFKEERRARQPINRALEQGFRRAWPSIVDSNISSILTATILYYTTTGLVRGFALTLALGIAVSMFTAITVTSTFLRLVLRSRLTPPVPATMTERTV
ncbi:protein translocase subunit SecD [Candidatus Berkelbacteria bacterium]|nr:protein translocase subunit SecD [Candidatus Berkelbacteria bacterium]